MFARNMFLNFATEDFFFVCNEMYIFGRDIKKKHAVAPAYNPIRAGPLWIGDVYRSVMEFLTDDECHTMWMIHKRYLQEIRPDPIECAPLHNISYIMWSLRRVQPHITTEFELRENYCRRALDDRKRYLLAMISTLRAVIDLIILTEIH